MRVRLAAAVGLLALAMALSTPAFGQYVGGTPRPAGPTSNPGGGGIDLSHSGTGGSDSSGTPDVRVSSGSFTPQSRGFAVTGADILQLVVWASACGVGGLVIVRATRRRATIA